MNRHAPRTKALACALAGLLVTACAGPVPQTQAPQQNLVSVNPGGIVDEPPFTFAVGDELDLRVPDASQFDQTLRVRPDGAVSLPLIGTVRVAGRTAEQVQAEIRERMDMLAGEQRDRDYLLHASDEIEIKFPYQAQLNEVVRIRPDGKIQLQMIGVAQAEGLSPEELKKNLTTRYARWLRRPDLTVLVRSVNSQSVRTANGAGRAGLKGLRPVVMVHSFAPAQIFVGGEVGRPGVLTYRKGLSLIQALVEAGGQLPSSDPTKLLILRRGAANNVEVVQAEYDKGILRTPDRDMLLRPYDVVVLPKSAVATLADNLNQYVYNLVPFLRNSSIGATYNLRAYSTQ